MKGNPYIWVLLEAGETHELFAELDDKTIDHIAELIFDVLEDEEDPEAPKEVAEVRDMIIDRVINSEEHDEAFSVYELRRQSLNVTAEGETLLEAPEFEVRRGAIVYEAATRITMGCDMCYALEPTGYFTEQIDSDRLRDAEWRQIILT